MNPRPSIFGLLSAGVLASAASAQTNVLSTQLYAWQENCGWLNWRDANAGAQGARLWASFLSGYVWGENIGWINLGNIPAGGATSYANADATNFGINVGPTGALSGFAWGENVGWINFSGGALASPAQPARLDQATNRLRGYAWGENIGWVNLDASTAGQFVQFTGACYANCDNSSNAPVLSAADFVCFLTKFRAGDAYANCDGSTTAPTLSAGDFVCFLSRFRAGCP